MAQNQSRKANTQAKVSPRSGTAPPPDKQFGKPNGNKQGRGFWKKEATARYKLERMMELTNEELRKVASDEKAPLFERKLAQCIASSQWKELEGMINQVYGMPKQQIEQHSVELKGILPKKKKG